MKRIIYLIIFICPLISFSQKIKLPQQDQFAWPDKNNHFPQIPDSLKNEDAVILKDEITVNEDRIQRRVAIKILSQNGLVQLSKIRLPENFDLTNYPNFKKMGRFHDRVDPYIYDYSLQYFSARTINEHKLIKDLNTEATASEVSWIASDGERIKDYNTVFELIGLKKGDILEYMYEANVYWDGRQNVIYPHSIYPKLECIINITTVLQSSLSGFELVYNYGIPNELVKKEIRNSNGNRLSTYTYNFSNLPGIRMPSNAKVGFTLPNISINHGSISSYRKGYYSTVLPTYTIYDKYKWVVKMDTSEKTKVYDNYHANIRKFISKIPTDPSDSTGSIFFTSLTDTLNNFKFISAESLNYSGKAQYAVSSTEQLLKGKLPEEFIFKNYTEFLQEKQIYFYDGIIMDKRYSVINPDYRNHSMLERKLIVLPGKRAFKYYMPRVGGVKYYTDELPFYFEGTKCILMPCYDCATNTKRSQMLFLTTPKSTYNENVRSEAGSFRILTDSMKIVANVKESLGGQFSTVLRHLYNGEYLDSTITANYFKKCTDKPHASAIKTKHSSDSKVFPFRQTYLCSENISQSSKTYIDCKNWFSFVWNKDLFPVLPNHDYYIDFQYTDTYNYLFEFDKSVEIINTSELTQKLSNEYFEVSVNLVKQEDSKYLLSVIVKVKQDKVSLIDIGKINEFVTLLDQINSLKIQYKAL